MRTNIDYTLVELKKSLSSTLLTHKFRQRCLYCLIPKSAKKKYSKENAWQNIATLSLTELTILTANIVCMGISFLSSISMRTCVNEKQYVYICTVHDTHCTL